MTTPAAYLAIALLAGIALFQVGLAVGRPWGACRLGRAAQRHPPDAAPDCQRRSGGRLSSADRVHRVVGRTRARLGLTRSRHRPDVGADGILPPGRCDQRRVAVADRALVGTHRAACRWLLRPGGTACVIIAGGRGTRVPLFRVRPHDRHRDLSPIIGVSRRRLTPPPAPLELLPTQAGGHHGPG